MQFKAKSDWNFHKSSPRKRSQGVVWKTQSCARERVLCQKEKIKHDKHVTCRHSALFVNCDDNSDWLGIDGGSFIWRTPPQKCKWGRSGRSQAVAPSNLTLAAVKVYMLADPPVSHMCSNFFSSNIIMPSTPTPPTFTTQLFLDFTILPMKILTVFGLFRLTWSKLIFGSGRMAKFLPGQSEQWHKVGILICTKIHLLVTGSSTQTSLQRNQEISSLRLAANGTFSKFQHHHRNFDFHHRNFLRRNQRNFIGEKKLRDFNT